MKRKTRYAVCGGLAALLAPATLPHASAAPAAPAPRLHLTAAAGRPSIFTLRYVAFVAQPKTKDVAALYKSFPPVLDQNLNISSRYAMTTTPEGFIKTLQAEQPDHDFKVSLAGSTVLYNYNVTRTQITDGPNSTDPYGLTLVDTISINQNLDTTLDFVSKGTLSDRRPESGEWAGTTGWDGENKELAVGRTYLWGVDKKPDGTCVTWAFCILPGRLDQVASAWNRRNGAPEKGMPLGKAVGVGQ